MKQNAPIGMIEAFRTKENVAQRTSVKVRRTAGPFVRSITNK
jgi:hypothetical protein